MKIKTYPETLVASAYLDAGESLCLFDKDGHILEGWPENWPDFIENVKAFLHQKGIYLAA